MPRLAAVRRRRLLTQRELAKRAGIAPSSVYSIEKGRVVPRVGVVRKIVAALGIEDPAEVDEFRALLAGGIPEAEHGQALSAATDPVLAELWDNDEDAVYDEVFAKLMHQAANRDEHAPA
jgi:transcriptional regulator with XRE-family HTH domain